MRTYPLHIPYGLAVPLSGPILVLLTGTAGFTSFANLGG